MHRCHRSSGTGPHEGQSGSGCAPRGLGWGRHRRDPVGSPRGAILCWGLSFALPFWVAAILRPGSSPGCAAPYPCQANACWGLLALPSPCGHLPGAGPPGAPTLSLGTQLPRPPQPPPGFPLPGLNGLLRAGGGCSRAAFVECSQWSVTCKQISAIM